MISVLGGFICFLVWVRKPKGKASTAVKETERVLVSLPHSRSHRLYAFKPGCWIVHSLSLTFAKSRALQIEHSQLPPTRRGTLPNRLLRFLQYVAGQRAVSLTCRPAQTKRTEALSFRNSEKIFLSLSFAKRPALMFWCSLHWSLAIIVYPGGGDAANGKLEGSGEPRTPCILQLDSMAGGHTNVEDLLRQ